ncbi:hypothetical protein LUZ60_010691 [Juncus effusus]|nr:hypothetical protein LUZ60_010691 [Juncus effusus]
MFKSAIVILLFLPSLTISTFEGARIELRHIDAKGNFTKKELIHRGIERTKRRLTRYHPKTSPLIVPLYFYDTEYVMDLKIGTPPLEISGIADTGSDLIWTQCANCKKCFTQPTKKYNPSKSRSFSQLPCNSAFCTGLNGPPKTCCFYNFTYGSAIIQGTIGTETFTVGSPNAVKKQNIVFGCTTKTTFLDTTVDFSNSTGLIGLGRGPYSLITQLREKKFSYCVNADVSTTSPLFLGSSAKLKGNGIKSTPFNTILKDDIHYQLNLEGISLGDTLLPIPSGVFPLNTDGSSGFVIDSGSSYSAIISYAYDVIKDAVKSVVNLSMVSNSDFDLCFSITASSPPPHLPDMTFHLSGADLVLPQDNYMTLVDEVTYCLAMSNSSDGSILGNYQQKNMHFLYDLEKEVLSFEPAECDKL